MYKCVTYLVNYTEHEMTYLITCTCDRIALHLIRLVSYTVITGQSCKTLTILVPVLMQQIQVLTISKCKQVCFIFKHFEAQCSSKLH
jgi:hypothetical protein